MRITSDAVTSARTGIPTYAVAEEDRKVSWTIDVQSLKAMEKWDALPPEERRRRLGLWQMGQRDALADYNGAAAGDDCSWLEQHAIVARNALRNYVGSVEVPRRFFRAYAGQVEGWMGWIEVNGKPEAWIASDGEVVDLSRISFADGEPAAVAPAIQ